MTLTANPQRNEYTALAAQTVFNYTFKIFVATELDVYITEAGVDANDTTDIISTFTVDPGTIGAFGGGFITLDSGATAGQLVTIVGNFPSARLTNYVVSGDFIPLTVNNDIDRAISIAKGAEELANRSVILQRSQQLSHPLSLPNPVPGFFLRWNSISTGLENATAPTVIVPSEVVGNVADMIANEDLVIGQFVWTTGYITVGDRGSNMYEIVAAATGTDDGGSFIDLAGSGNQAKGLFTTAFINVKQFGAIGDNATNDTLAFINTLAFAPDHSIVLVPYPDVKYSVLGMTITKPVTLRGENFTPITHVANEELFVIESSDVLIEQFDIVRSLGSAGTFKIDSTVNRDNITIRDCTADLSKSFLADSNSTGNITNLTVSNISSTRQENDGINLIDATDNLIIHDIWISYVGSAAANNSTAFDINNALSGNLYNLVAYGLVTATTDHNGFEFSGLDDLKITNLFATGFGNDSYKLVLSNIELINWSATECKGTGVNLAFCEDCKIVGSTFIANATVAANTNGLFFNNLTNNCSVTGCQIEDYSKDGINTVCNKLKVSDSYMVNNGGYGIRGETLSAFSVMNCDLQGNTLGDIFRNAAAPQDDFAQYNTFDAGVIQGPNIFQKLTTISFNGSVDFELDPNYQRHRFWPTNVKPFSDDVAFTMLCFIDGGTTPETGASDYDWTYQALISGVEVNGADAADADIDLTPAGSSQGIGQAAGEDGLSGYIDIFNPADATQQKMISWNLVYTSAAGTQSNSLGSATLNADDDITDIRFLMSSGTLASGKIIHEASI